MKNYTKRRKGAQAVPVRFLHQGQEKALTDSVEWLLPLPAFSCSFHFRLLCARISP